MGPLFLVEDCRTVSRNDVREEVMEQQYVDLTDALPGPSGLLRVELGDLKKLHLYL